MCLKICLDKNIFSWFFCILKSMIEFFFHSIVRKCQIRFKKKKHNLIDILVKKWKWAICPEEYIWFFYLSCNCWFFYLGVWVNTQYFRLRKEMNNIWLNSLNSNTDHLESTPSTSWTDDGNMINISTLMTNESTSRWSMVSKGDITMRTPRKITTILTDPCTARASTIIEKKDFLIFLENTWKSREKLIRDKWSMDKTRTKWYECKKSRMERYICMHKRNVIQVHLR